MQVASGSEERLSDLVLRVTRRSTFTGKTRVRDLVITAKEWDAWQAGALIQNAMPGLAPSDREFLMTGVTQEEWDNVFGKEDEE